MHSTRIVIKGLVQGIGFRPFIYNLARRSGIRGYVQNRSDAVEVLAQGTVRKTGTFIDGIQKEPPPLARIDSVTTETVDSVSYNDFSIVSSEDAAGGVTDVSPDIAVCDLCLADMEVQPHRIGYPLINCTLCGPRFSILRAVPYDRPNTTMAPFAMCEACAAEYNDPADRRFHAQPVACNACGPVYTLYHGDELIQDSGRVISETAGLLERGAIVAVKGTGGFHLACSPLHIGSVQRLRSGKRRDGKPFAVMFRDLETVREFAEVDRREAQLLESAVRPIVLLKGGSGLPPEVSNGLATVGAMLPYMPFHYLLFRHLSIPALVMTSGNLSEEPIVIDDTAARKTFRGIADAVVGYNRAIHNRVDDSVCAVYGGRLQLLRRSRGFAPSPVKVGFNVQGIVGTGAELKNCFALGRGETVIVSQHIGDLKNSETFLFYREAFERLCSLFRVTPLFVAHDTHPDYLSTRFARESGLPAVPVQHHHAHIASCCAENGIGEKVIGVALDGTGYGDDGAIWGGEFMIADLCGYERRSHLRYVGMPGGDKAAVEPWRMAVSYLHDACGSGGYGALVHAPDEESLRMITTALEKKINTPFTSSAGRLFDAVAALCGLCDTMTFEAEAAMRLEAACGDPLQVEPYPWKSENGRIDFREMFIRIVDERRNGTTAGEISTRFHGTVLDVIVETCRRIRADEGFNSVVLTGGCFQNRCIFEGALQLLSEDSFTVYTHSRVPCNDGGVALGQCAVAAISSCR